MVMNICIIKLIEIIYTLEPRFFCIFIFSQKKVHNVRIPLDTRAINDSSIESGLKVWTY